MKFKLRKYQLMREVAAVSTVAEPVKNRKFSKASLEAGDRLLKAVKDKLLKEHGQVDEEELRRRGYSEATIERVRSL
jgi:hypothetical protein